jgi:polyisoprenoid-binding protein YceI
MRTALASFLVVVPLSGCGYLIPAQHQTIEPAALRAGAYRLDPDHAVLLWKVDHLGFSTFVGRFDRLEGSLDFDPEEPESAALDVVVDMASVSTHVPSLTDDLRSPTWLDTGRFPEARFVSRSVEVTGPDRGIVTGDLTLLGETGPITFDVTFNGGATNMLTGNYTLGFSAAAVIDRSEFGLATFVPAIGREVTLEIYAEFFRTDAGPETNAAVPACMMISATPNPPTCLAERASHVNDG